MRPTRLELEGFTSFRQNVAVDFSSLDLFAITGPTGAGKTSLIDAIVYALYGRTPRISDKAASDLISQGVERMRVFLEFQAGTKRYRILRTLRRGTSTKLQLEMQDSKGEWEALSNRVFEVRDKIQQILGIDFNGFIKSIVLPQGEFDKFLRGDPVERRRILADLLHLGIYEEMGKRARQVEQNARLEQSLVEKHLATTYANVTAENKSVIETELKTLLDEQNKISEESKVIQKLQAPLIELRKQRDRIVEATTEHGRASDNLKKLDLSLVSLKDKAERHKKRLAEIEGSIATCGYSNERHLELSSIIPVAEEREEWQKALAAAEKEYRETKATLTRLEPIVAKEKQKWERSTADLKAAEEVLQNAKKQYEASKKIHGSADAILQVIKDLQAASEQFEEKQELLQKIERTDKALGDAKEQVVQLTKDQEEAEAALREARSTLEHLQEQHAANEIRQQLKRGDKCPVCEQIITTIPARRKHEPLSHAREFVEEKQKARDRCNTALLKKQNLCESLPSELKILRQNLRSIETAISAATTKAERILEKRPGKSAVSDLEKLVERISTLESQYEAAADRFHDAQEAESQAREHLKEQEHEFKLFTRQIGALEKGVAEKTAKLKALSSQLRGQPDLRALSEERKQLEKAKKQKETYDSQRKQEEATFSAAEKLRVTAEAEVSGLQARLKELDVSIAAARASGDRLEQRIRSELALPKGVDEVKELESRRISLEKRSLDLAGHVATKRAELESLVQALADLAIKGKQMQDLKARADLFHELGVALKADQFIRFIVEEALTRLAAYGTEHLRRLSLDRYAFATATDDFAVIDHWNADESRSVNTLSGGESFVASLSLALALSDALAELSTDHTTSRLDSLFLDEGFSTLDPETLDVSVQAVEALAGGDRLVGIISHVPELAERFPCRIEVKKAIGGSTLTVTGNDSETGRSTTA